MEKLDVKKIFLLSGKDSTFGIMENIVKLNQPEYAKKMGISKASVGYRIKNNIFLPGVVKIERFKNFYLLHFDVTTDLKNARKSFKKSPEEVC